MNALLIPRPAVRNQQIARPTLLRAAGEPSRQPTNKASDRPVTVATGDPQPVSGVPVSPVVAAVGLPRRWGAGLIWSRRWPGLFPAGSTHAAVGRPNHPCLATTRTPTPSRSGPSARAGSQGQNASQTNVPRLTPSAPGRPRHHPCYLVSSLQNSRLCAPSLISSEWPLTSHNGGSGVIGTAVLVTSRDGWVLLSARSGVFACADSPVGQAASAAGAATESQGPHRAGRRSSASCRKQGSVRPFPASVFGVGGFEGDCMRCRRTMPSVSSPCRRRAADRADSVTPCWVCLRYLNGFASAWLAG
jgi:hypothetical protein